MKRVFIAGHNGMVGSAILNILKKKNNYKIITASKNKVNLENFTQTENFFKKNNVDEIYLCAAKVGGIEANNKFPVEFMLKNLNIQNNCISLGFKYNVRKILFLGSSCIYPKFSKQPIKESYLLSGKLEDTNEAYALAKISGLKLCQYYNTEFKTDFRAVMPTNLYGPNDNYDLNNSHVIPALIKKTLLLKKKPNKPLIIWGTGKPKREFLHSQDLAEGCIKIMNLSKKRYKDILGEDSCINIGSGEEVTIKHLAENIKKIINIKNKIRFDKSKPDGTPRKILDISKIKKTGWRPKIDLNNGLAQIIKKVKIN
ncbi:GDP-L-fucose synthase [Candidatus Pelagibacter ubique]|nr:GDP-L-fucose synthase [Candidatus Pelagibacter ubique]